MEGMIGLEIHAYLVTKEKLFCKCKASRKKGETPNSFICPICTAQPGAKPMLPNKTAIEKSVQVASMLKCQISELMPWQRKHYNWPDLPKGYQSTLSGPHATPVGTKGNFHGIRIKEMHLEEDPASWDPATGRVDYNRSGIPLVEIVTEPDFTTSEEVNNWLVNLLRNLEYLKAVSSNAGIKVDVNVSIPEKTQRVEIKNLNSLENISAAIEYELKRQSSEGSTMETRRYDDKKNKTIVMRSKEQQEDYRFIADPDLKPIVLDKNFIEKIRKTLPESPEKKLEKLIRLYKIDEKNAEVLAKNLDIVEFFEEVSKKIDPSFASRWVNVELLRHLNYNKVSLNEIDLDVQHFIELLQMAKKGEITELQAKQILNKFYPKSFSPKNSEKKISNESDLKNICLQVMKENPEAVTKFKSGDKKIINFLLGQVMQKTNRRADFQTSKRILEKLMS